MKNPVTKSSATSRLDSFTGNPAEDGFDQVAWQNRQKQRNTVLLWVLLGLVGLFFAISVVQFARGGHL